ncbi:MAG: NusG domain II-containing protein [Lachnospiraceae bacterium]|nr:NusG domain II-containing protein [Lachnospiraceae bacterium]
MSKRQVTGKMSQKKWILLFIIMIAAMAGIWFFLTRSTGADRIVTITGEGKTLYTIDLASAKDDEFVITDSKGGRNTVVIQNGEIYVKEADCPDGICVKHGPLQKNGTPIVCLPHQLVIRWASDTSEVDN